MVSRDDPGVAIGHARKESPGGESRPGSLP
jgi:hypothetical protein